MTATTIAIGESLDTWLTPAHYRTLSAVRSDRTVVMSPPECLGGVVFDSPEYITGSLRGDDPLENRWEFIGADVNAQSATFAKRTPRFQAAEKAAAFIRARIPVGTSLTEVFRSKGGMVISTSGLEPEYRADHPTIIGKIIDSESMLWFTSGVDDEFLLSNLLAYRIVAYRDSDNWHGACDVDATDFLEGEEFAEILPAVASMLRAAAGAPMDELALRAWAALDAAEIERRALTHDR